MVKITKDGRTVVYAGSMILKDNETVRLEIALPVGATIAAQMLKLEIVFTGITNLETDITWKTSSDGTVQFELTGWRQTGQALREPLHFGQYNGEKLWLNIAQHRIGLMVNVVQIDVLQGGRADVA
jgi:hypothetical protein